MPVTFHPRTPSCWWTPVCHRSPWSWRYNRPPTCLYVRCCSTLAWATTSLKLSCLRWRSSSGSPKLPLASWHPQCSWASDLSHRMQRNKRLYLLPIPRPRNLCVSAPKLHHSLHPHNSSSCIRASTGASCIPKMCRCSCRAFLSPMNYPYLCPWSCLKNKFHKLGLPLDL